MLCPNYTEELISLKDLYVKSVERIGQKLYIYAGMYQRIHKCPHCGERTSKVHDYRTQEIKDISAFGEMTIICLKKRRHICPVCGKKFYEEVSFLPKYHRMTNRLAAYVIDALKEIGSMKNVAINTNISQSKSRGFLTILGIRTEFCPGYCPLMSFVEMQAEKSFNAL